MSTNEVFTFDMTGNGKTLVGKSHGPLLAHAKATDCRALCVGHDGKAWAAVTEQGRPSGGALLHIIHAAWTASPQPWPRRRKESGLREAEGRPG
ncbi:MAG: hypothetical protein U0744_18690 [Gemmataceae bacterium]